MKIAELAPQADRAVALLAAMANEKRLLILCNLLEEELSVGELAERVGLAQSPLSQHLSRLRAMQLVSTRRDGQMILYSLASPDVARVLTTLYEIYCGPARGRARAGRKANG